MICGISIVSLPPEILSLSHNISLILIKWYFFSFRSENDDLDQVTFLSLIAGVNNFPILVKNFPQSHLILV